MLLLFDGFPPDNLMEIIYVQKFKQLLPSFLFLLLFSFFVQSLNSLYCPFFFFRTQKYSYFTVFLWPRLEMPPQHNRMPLLTLHVSFHSLCHIIITKMTTPPSCDIYKTYNMQYINKTYFKLRQKLGLSNRLLLADGAFKQDTHTNINLYISKRCTTDVH